MNEGTIPATRRTQNENGWIVTMFAALLLLCAWGVIVGRITILQDSGTSGISMLAACVSKIDAIRTTPAFSIASGSIMASLPDRN